MIESGRKAMTPFLPFDLLAETLLAFRRVAPAQRAAVVEQRFFPVHAGGALAFRVPRDWHEEIEIAGERSTIAFQPKGRRGRLLHLSLQTLSPGESASFSVEEMRQEVERAASAADQDRAAPIEPFAGRFGGGFLFSVPRSESASALAHPEYWKCAVVRRFLSRAGGLARLTQGLFLVRPVLLEFAIESSRAEQGLHAAALELVRSARASSA